MDLGGIEGFCETVAQEIAPFGIGLMIEPGADGTPSLPNDPEKIVEAIISLVDSGATPLRLPLGSDTYDDVRAALVARLAERDAHREVAFSVGQGKPQ